MLSKYIFLAGTKLRNPSLISWYYYLKYAEKWPIEKSVEYQIEKCRDLLHFANENSPFWRKYFEEHNFLVSQFNSLEDLKKLPPISKSDLLKFNFEIHSNFNFNKRFFSETSGTTGEVLKFWKDEEWDSFNRASIMRGYSWHGVKPWDRNGYFWGYNFKQTEIWKTRLLDLLQNRFRLFSYEKKPILKFVKKLQKAKYLHGYSSMIYEVAKICNQLGLKINSLKMVKGTSEKIYDPYQSEIHKAFGITAINEYGAAETGIIGFECPFGKIHVNMQGVIIEEENNEIIVTNLVSKSFPVIRYKLGDYIELSPVIKCNCGLHTPIIKTIIGRIGKTVYGINNLYPSLTFYYIFKNLALNHSINLNYQAIQHTKGDIIFNIEQHLSITDKEKLTQEINKYFKDDIRFEIQEGQHLHKMDGKQKDFISTI
ncbi:MAG: phenylacetate--CoA ligase family protein [Prolixibacteraceae bacterium]|jgi:phenylacetate-CoA ligase|nr:phenylacetate--CoA ligase family protein [Prolixibacteraceae bacterium]MBT6004806.1 phenylacetate--CoA ligase family protein [Prolixibacteraceae bacterium]MBT6766916.1 phenylacetate--CoA ligase family protein [Prolixibacteraceae bacterium]MBT7394765.1 phenylacetate--CoA ligase family protein [Prolixibacteraceae bacterium]